jgi:alginate O-acetyltransferase complex protein AlgI
MVFSSFAFLFYFLPVTIAAIYLAPKTLRNPLLAFASFLFYSWGEPRFALVFLGFCLLNFSLALLIERLGASPFSKVTVISGLAGNVSALLYFKYSNFFLSEFNRTLSFLGQPPIIWENIILPLGISFTTFQSISYLVDVYRGKCPAEKKLRNYLGYALLFPHLISGPIVRYCDLKLQLEDRTLNLDGFYEGFLRFSRGLAKKVLIADVIGHTANAIFAADDPQQLTQTQAWLGMLAYTAQLYFDFSGYTDMAIGLARILGFHFPENFDQPFLANSFTDYWRRWHISFGLWMRDYIYFPLGGSRCSPLKVYLNLWIIFLISGLWHGAQWTFVLWGAYHGFFMTIERFSSSRFQIPAPNVIKVLTTLLLVMLSRVLFRAEDLTYAVRFYKQMFNPTLSDYPKVWGYLTSEYELAMLLLAYVVCLYPLLPVANKIVGRVEIGLDTRVGDLARAVVGVSLFVLSVVALAGRDSSPFIYFQF